jgi:hypothetical protein
MYICKEEEEAGEEHISDGQAPFVGGTGFRSIHTRYIKDFFKMFMV